MLLAGTIRDRTIILDEKTVFPDGERVGVELKPLDLSLDDDATDSISPVATPTLIGLQDLIGVLDDLPPDFAAEHDHYIHGTPKRQLKDE